MTTPPSLTISDNYNTYINTLDTAYVLDSLDIFYIAAINNRDNAGLNYIDPTGGENINDGDTVSFTAYEGWDGDATNDYLNTNYNPTNDATHYKQDDNCGFIYLREVLATTYEEYEFGGRDSSDGAGFYITGLWNVGKTIYWRTGNSSSHSYTRTDATRQGFVYAERTASDASEIFVNNSSESTSSTASYGIPNVNMYILGGNNGGVLTGVSSNSFSVFGMGASLTASQRTTLYNATEILMDSLGTGVIE
jgi:hypothetical protein